MKKIILFVGITILLFISSIWFINLEKDKNYISILKEGLEEVNSIKGSVALNLPSVNNNENDLYKSITKKIVSININELKMDKKRGKINFKGQIKENDEKINFDIRGVCFQSHIKASDILIDCEKEYFSNRVKYEIVFWKIYHQISNNELSNDLSLSGKDVMVVQIYDKKNSKLLCMEIELNESELELNSTNTYKLSENILDAWLYKVMPPIIYEEGTGENELPLLSESNNKKCFMAAYYFRCPIKESRYEVFVKNYMVTLDGANKMKNQDMINTNLQIVNSKIEFHNGNDINIVDDSKCTKNKISLGYKDKPIILAQGYNKTPIWSVKWVGNNIEKYTNKALMYWKVETKSPVFNNSTNLINEIETYIMQEGIEYENYDLLNGIDKDEDMILYHGGAYVYNDLLKLNGIYLCNPNSFLNFQTKIIVLKKSIAVDNRCNVQLKIPICWGELKEYTKTTDLEINYSTK